MMRLLPIVLAGLLAAAVAHAQTPPGPAAAGPSPAAAPAQPTAEPSNNASAPSASPVLTEPSDAELLPPKHETHGEAQIEQIRQGNRIVEVIVTPAGQKYSYTIQNRDGQRPISPQQIPGTVPSLSIPSFLKFEF